MLASSQPVIVRPLTRSLRIHQGISIATTLLFTLLGFAGWLYWSKTTEDVEFACFVAWFFLAITILQLLIMLSYDIFFIVDGQKQWVVRVRRWWGWQWTRIYPAQEFTEVQTYRIGGSPIAGRYLQLLGKKTRLRLAYCPSGKGLEELADRIAEQLQLPYYREAK